MNESTEIARCLLAELLHQGVTEVVLAPGSRSAPLAFAVMAAAGAGLCRLHVRLDERDAGFLALGLAKLSGEPVVVACTSGTAVANLSPAVVEASFSAVPLVALTADRPLESRGVGSPQTIDQVDFFGTDVRFSADLSAERVASFEPAGLTDEFEHRIRGTVAHAIGAALGTAAGRVGPVHLNVGFRMPLVPSTAQYEAMAMTGRRPADPTRPGSAGPTGVGAAAGRGPARYRRRPLLGCGTRDIGEVLAEDVGRVPTRGVVFAGDLPPTFLQGAQQWLAELAAACGWPVIAEPSANLAGAPTALRHGVLVLGTPDFLERHRPDLVVSAGLSGLSRPTLGLLRAARHHIALDLPGVGRQVCDPMRTAQRVLDAIPLPPAHPSPDPSWLGAWKAADAAVASALAVVPAGFTGITAACATAGAVPAGGLLHVAASWPVRHVEAFARVDPAVRVVGNRGANGIDGLISTAWGAALSHQSSGGGPAFALMGDLAFLHDHNGLLVGRAEPVPDLTIVVVDNNGGGIFSQLEQGSPAYAADFERLFGTPLDRDLAAIARASGWPAVAVHSAAELAAALAPASVPGVRVVVAAVAERPAELADLRARTAAAHAAALHAVARGDAD